MEVRCNSVAVEAVLWTKPADFGMAIGGQKVEALCDGCEVTLVEDAHVPKKGIRVGGAEEVSAAGSGDLPVRNEHVGMPVDDPVSLAKTDCLAADSFEDNCCTGTARDTLEEKPCAPVLVQEGFAGISVTVKKPTENPDGTVPSLHFHGTDHVQAKEPGDCFNSDGFKKVTQPNEVSNLLVAKLVPLMAEDLPEKGTGIGKDSEKVLENDLQLDQQEGLASPIKLSTLPEDVAGRGSSVHEPNRVLYSTDAVMFESKATYSGRPNSPLVHSESGEYERDLVTDDLTLPLELDHSRRGDTSEGQTLSIHEGFNTRGGEDRREKDVKKAEDASVFTAGSVRASESKSTLVYPEQSTDKDLLKASLVHPLVSEKSLGVPVEHFLENGTPGACMFSSPLSNPEHENVANFHVNRAEGLLAVTPVDLSAHDNDSNKHGSDRVGVDLSNVKGHDGGEAAIDVKGVHATFQVTSSGVVLELSSKWGNNSDVKGIVPRADYLPAQGQVVSNEVLCHKVERTCSDNLEDCNLIPKGEEDGVPHCHTSPTSETSKQLHLTMKAAIFPVKMDRGSCGDAVDTSQDMKFDREHMVKCLDGMLQDADLEQLSCSTSSDQGLSVIKDVHCEVEPSSVLSRKCSSVERTENLNLVQLLPVGFEEWNSLGKLPTTGSISMTGEAGGAASSFETESGAAADICDVGKDSTSEVQNNQPSVGEAMGHASCDAHVGDNEISGSAGARKERKVESTNSNQEGQDLIEGQDQNSTNCAQGGGSRVIKTGTDNDLPEFFGCAAAEVEMKRIASGDSYGGSKELLEGADQSSANCVTEATFMIRQEAAKSRECQLEPVSVYHGRKALKGIEDNPVRILRPADLETLLESSVPIGDKKTLKLPKLGTLEDTTTLQQAHQPAWESKPSCDCGVPAIEKVVGSKSENRGLRYLSCGVCHKQTNLKKRKQPETKWCSFFQWVDVPRVTEEERKINRKQKRLRLEQDTYSGPVNLGNVCTRAASKQKGKVKLSGQNATINTSSSMEASAPQQNLALELSSSAVDTTLHHGSTSTASEVAMPLSKQASQRSSLKKKSKTPRQKVGSELVLSPTKSSVTAASLREPVKSASTSKSGSLSSSSPPEAGSKSAKGIPEKSFRKRYFDDRNNPTVDFLVSKRLAFKSLNELVDRPVKSCDRKIQVGQPLVTTDVTEFRPKRRKLAAIIKSETVPAVKGKPLQPKAGGMVKTQDSDSVKEVNGRASVPVAADQLLKVDKKIIPSSSKKDGNGKRKRVSKDKVLAMEPSASKRPRAVKKPGTIQGDAHADGSPIRPSKSKSLKAGHECPEQKKVIETCKSGEAVWIDVPLCSPVGSYKEAKEKHPQLLGEKARAHLRNNKASVQRDKGRDQDSSQPEEEVQGTEAGFLDASQVDVDSAKESIKESLHGTAGKDGKFSRHNTDRSAMRSDGYCTTGMQRNRRINAVS